MLSKRVLLLGAALASFSAMMVGGAFAFSAATDSDTSDLVDVADPVAPDLTLENHVTTIPANGAPNKIDDIFHVDNDSNYAWALTQLDVNQSSATTTGTCAAFDYSLDGGVDSVGSLAIAVPSAAASTTYSLFLSIPSSGTQADCQITGGVVTGTFQIP